ncbi:hypothetical protein MMC29_006310, partial [Sticta canariensis]|nr:hypothetical protein [Sticta canariensis]
MLRHRSAPLAVAEYSAITSAGTTVSSIARRTVHLRGETKAANGPSTAPEALWEKSPQPSIITTATHLPPGARTPTRSRGRPRDPKPILSAINYQPITISVAPKTRKRTAGDDNEDDGEPTRKKLKWNIHDDYAEEHWQAKKTTKRARVLDFIDVKRPDIIDLDGPEVINLVTPSSTAGSSDWDSEDSDSSIATT